MSMVYVGLDLQSGMRVGGCNQCGGLVDEMGSTLVANIRGRGDWSSHEVDRVRCISNLHQPPKNIPRQKGFSKKILKSGFSRREVALARKRAALGEKRPSPWPTRT